MEDQNSYTSLNHEFPIEYIQSQVTINKICILKITTVAKFQNQNAFQNKLSTLSTSIILIHSTNVPKVGNKPCTKKSFSKSIYLVAKNFKFERKEGCLDISGKEKRQSM